jgi:inner membrane protein
MLVPLRKGDSMTDTLAAIHSTLPSGRAAGPKALLIVALTIAMALPLLFISFVLDDRRGTATAAAEEIANSSGGPQTVQGPILVIPYSVDLPAGVVIDGKPQTVREDGVRIVLPENLNIVAQAATQTRARGIYTVPVFESRIDMRANFSRETLEKLFPANARIRWQDASIVMSVSDARGLAENIALREGAASLPFQPGFGAGMANTDAKDRQGLHALLPLDGARDIAVSTQILLRGSRELNFVPLGRRTAVSLDSPWASPSFAGAFLPGQRTIDQRGFRANWVVPYLARGFEQVFETPATAMAAFPKSAFGVRFYQPVDFYQLVTRALKYAVLFVAMAFLSFFVVEIVTQRRLHAVQYALVGAAQVLFYLLLLSLSEHVGFALAYLAAAGGTVVLTGLYAAAAFRSRARAGVLTAILAALYSLLYVILNAEDASLLIGSGMLFAALAGTMYVTRRIDWYGVAENQ